MSGGEYEGAWEAVRAIYDRYTEPGRFDAIITAHDAEQQALGAERGWDAATTAMRYEDGTPVELVSVVNPYRADRLRAEREGAGEGEL